MTPPNVSIVLIMLCFWVTLWLVNRFLIRPVNTVLEQRHDQIDGAQRAWTKQNDELLAATARIEDDMVEAARAAAKTRESFRTQAQQEKQTELQAARGEAEKRLEAALAGLEKETETARRELRDQADSLAQEFARRLLGREVRS